VDFTAYYMVAMATLGAFSGALNGNAIRISEERKLGWIRQLRLTPLPANAYVIAKLLVSMATTIPSIVIVFLLGRFYGGVHAVRHVRPRRRGGAGLVPARGGHQRDPSLRRAQLSHQPRPPREDPVPGSPRRRPRPPETGCPTGLRGMSERLAAVGGEFTITPGTSRGFTALAEGACPLTSRERDVLAAGRDGATITEIAAALYLSEGTVRNYLSSCIQKTGARNRAEALRIAEERGWL
jgi:DNA-binding CsgD family transcriptional regulator